MIEVAELETEVVIHPIQIDFTIWKLKCKSIADAKCNLHRKTGMTAQ